MSGVRMQPILGHSHTTPHAHSACVRVCVWCDCVLVHLNVADYDLVLMRHGLVHRVLIAELTDTYEQNSAMLFCPIALRLEHGVLYHG